MNEEQSVKSQSIYHALETLESMGVDISPDKVIHIATMYSAFIHPQETSNGK